MVIRQGDVFWVDLGPPFGSEPGFRRPFVVMQNNLFNSTRIGTVVVCGITSNLRRGISPGNVSLKKGEANLPKKCVVNITQMLTLDKKRLQEKIGSLQKARVEEIFSGLELLLQP